MASLKSEIHETLRSYGKSFVLLMERKRYKLEILAFLWPSIKRQKLKVVLERTPESGTPVLHFFKDSYEL